MHSPILAPVVALVLWSLVMLLWVYVTRAPALRAAGISLKGRVGIRGQALDGLLPDAVQWKAHNYNHLMEQPTIFYAVSLALAVAGLGDGLNVKLAWLYVGTRIVHSVVQATINRLLLRFAIFALGSLVLCVLAVRAGVAILG